MYKTGRAKVKEKLKQHLQARWQRESSGMKKETDYSGKTRSLKNKTVTISGTSKE